MHLHHHRTSIKMGTSGLVLGQARYWKGHPALLVATWSRYGLMFFFFFLYEACSFLFSPHLHIFLFSSFFRSQPCPAELLQAQSWLGFFFQNAPHVASRGLDCLVPYLQVGVDTSLSLCLLPCRVGVSDLSARQFSSVQLRGLGNSSTTLLYMYLHRTRSRMSQVTRVEFVGVGAPQLWIVNVLHSFIMGME